MTTFFFFVYIVNKSMIWCFLQKCEEEVVEDVCYDQSCNNVTVPVFKKQCRCVLDQFKRSSSGLRYSCSIGTPTKRQVSKRPVSKRPVSKRQAYKTSGLQNVRIQNVWFQNVQFFNLIYSLNKKYRNCQVCIPIKVKSVSFLLITSNYGDIWQKNPLK